jgi:putative hydrolase of the HAD superfamily
MQPVLFSDADNTLWETDAVYRQAHRWLFSEVTNLMSVHPEGDDPISFVRAIDQEIAASHPNHLNYPPLLLVQELLARLSGRELSASLEGSVAEISANFERMLIDPPVLREGVKDGLIRLQALQYPVHVITEGSLNRCSRLLGHHKIARYVESVRAVKKDKQHFAALYAQLTPNLSGWVVGDQLTRDILPARAAGLQTIYFPGSFVPTWEQSVTPGPETAQIDTFASVPLIIQKANVCK